MTQSQSGRPGDRALELFAALLLGLATIGTAWCAYRATYWNHEESIEARTAAQARLEASRQFGLGVQKISYDATIAAMYAQAFVEAKPELQRFYKDYLMRPEFLPVIEGWESNAAGGGTQISNLFENKDYIEAQLSESKVADASAEEALRRGDAAGDNADGFTQTTIFAAATLFFAGVTSNFRSYLVRLMLLGAANVTFAVAVARIVDLSLA